MIFSRNSRASGHAAALFTAFVWGCTFISSKVLLTAFNSVEILFLRFIMGFIILLLIQPKIEKPRSFKSELYFIGAGFTGVTGYYLLENIALTHTLAANVSVITCTAPFFTALAAWLFLKEKKMTPLFFLGFIISIGGIALLSLYGTTLQIDLIGTIMAVSAAMCWGLYSVLVKKACETGMNTIAMTQRFFFYGLLFMAPFMKMFGFAPEIGKIFQLKYLLNLLFLGVVASALCFLTWNFALARLGTVEASVYIYLTPVITVIVSFFILQERITFAGLIGIALTLAGVILSEFKPTNSKECRPE